MPVHRVQRRRGHQARAGCGMNWIAVARYGAAIAFFCLFVWRVYSFGYDAAVRDAEALVSAEKTEQLRMIAAEQERASAIDERLTKELNDEQEKHRKLADCVAAGKCGLRVAARCPRVPAATGADPGLDQGSQQAELDAAAQPTYRALLDGIALKEKALQACIELSER